MTDWRHPALAAVSALLILAGGAALAQPSADDPLSAPLEDDTTGAPPLQGPVPDRSLPASPAEEKARHQARLDALFAQLGQKNNPDWERVQNDIWIHWSKSGSPSMDLLLLRAGRAMDAGDHELALRFLDDLVRLAPEFAEGWNKRATVYFLLGEYGPSVADIQRTLVLEPRHFGALSGLGMILERVGDKKGAIRAYRRGLEIHPNLPGAAEGVERLAPEVDGREL